MPAARHVAVISESFDAHVALTAAGWIACDLYDGCLTVDFSSGPHRAAILVRATSLDPADRYRDVAAVAAAYASAN